MGLEDTALPASLCLCSPQATGSRPARLASPSSRLCSHSQAWHVFRPLSGRDDSPEKMLQLRYFLNENLCFVLIQIYKGRGETSKSPYWSWMSNDPISCRIKTATTFPLRSHRSQTQQKHVMFPEMPEGTSPPSQDPALLHGIAGYQLLSRCFGSFSSGAAATPSLPWLNREGREGDFSSMP